MIYRRVRNHFPSRRFFLHSTAFVSISLASIVGIQSITQWSESPQAIASETYPGCDVPDRDWQPGNFQIVSFPRDPGDQIVPIRTVTFSPSEEFLSSGHANGLIRLWRLSTWNGNDMRQVDNSESLLPSDTGRVRGITSLSFSPDENFLVSGHSDGVVALWNISEGSLNLVETSLAHSENRASITSTQFTRNGYLVTAAHDKIIRIWDLDNGQLSLLREMRSSLEIKSISVSADEQHIAVAGVGPRNIVEIWDLSTGDLINEMGPYPKSVYAVAFHPCSPNVLAFSPDSTSVPEIEVNLDQTNTIRLWDIEDGMELGITFEGHEQEIETLAFSPSGNLLMSGSWDGTIRMWNVATGDESYANQIGQQRILSVAFSPSAQKFAVGLGETVIRVAGL